MALLVELDGAAQEAEHIVSIDYQNKKEDRAMCLKMNPERMRCLSSLTLL